MSPTAAVGLSSRYAIHKTAQKKIKLAKRIPILDSSIQLSTNIDITVVSIGTETMNRHHCIDTLIFSDRNAIATKR